MHIDALNIKSSNDSHSVGSKSLGMLPGFMLFLMMMISGCIMPFEANIDKYENLLVVDGILTNVTGSCKVNLSRTYPYSGTETQALENARVRILDDLGNETALIHTRKGNYTASDTAFHGVVGRAYKLIINTDEGETFESVFETLKEPVPVERLYYQYQIKQDGIKGFQVFIDACDPTGKSLYYSWNYQETWEFDVPFESSNRPNVNKCFKTVNSNSFLFQSSRDYQQDEINSFPICFIDGRTNRLSIKYSILVRQYVLTEESYLFFKNLKDVNESAGSIFDQIPVTVTGNMRNIDNPSNPVLGNFQVSGESSERIFIYRNEIPYEMIIPTEFEYCQMEYLSNQTQMGRLDSLRGRGWVIMDTIPQAEEDTLIGISIRKACFDCSVHGNPHKPDYWDEH